MNTDSIWQLNRYGLIAMGSWITKGYISGKQWETIIGAIVTFFRITGGLFMTSGTKAVLQAVAARADVSMASGATGTVQK